MIDLHCHVLPGIDDGPGSLQESLALARVAADAGVLTIVATPHVSWRYRNNARTIAALVSELNQQLRREALSINVCAGAEIASTILADLDPAELSGLTLGRSSWLLIEPPFSPVVSGLESIIGQARRDGNRIVLAHPERCPAFHRDPKMLGALVRDGALSSVTAGSLTGRFGTTVKRFAMQMVREQLVHNVASDAHDTIQRAPGMAQHLEKAKLGPLSQWLTCEVPHAILNDEPIPARPAMSWPRQSLFTPRHWRQ
jgi:protein-tyrosine phosphatase